MSDPDTPYISVSTPEAEVIVQGGPEDRTVADLRDEFDHVLERARECETGDDARGCA